MAAIVLGNTQVINSGSTTPIVLPVTDLPIPNVVVLDEVTLINSGGTVITSTGGIIRISDLSSGDSILSNLFYEYNDVIYRSLTNHVYNGTFITGNFIPQGARLETQVFEITNDATSVLTLTTSPAGKILNLFVNGLEYLEDVNFTKGGSGNKTLTFAETLPWDTDYSPTYVEVNVIPDDSVSWGTGTSGGGVGTVTSVDDFTPDVLGNIALTKPHVFAGSNNIDLSYPNGESQLILTSNLDFTPITSTAVRQYSHLMKLDLAGYTPTFSGFTFMETQLAGPDLVPGQINVVMFINIGGTYFYTWIYSYTGVLDDNDPPILSSISISGITQILALINATSNENSTLYWGVYSNGATAPTYNQLVVGTGAIDFGAKSLTGNVAGNDTMTGLVYSTPYDVYYAALDSAGNSTTPALIEFSTIARTQLTAPVVTVASAGQTQLNISVNANVNGVEVYISTTSGGTYSLYETLVASDLTCEPLTGLTQGTTRYFKAIALGDDLSTIDSALSIEYSGTTSTVIQLNAPGSFAATPASQSQINLTWTDVSNESSYLIEVSDNGTSGWSTLASKAANSTSHNHTGLTAGTTKYYRISSIGDGTNYSDSGYSTANATTSNLVQLNAVTGLSSTPNTSTQNTLNWTDTNTSPNETYFRVRRSVNSDMSSASTLTSTLAANSTQYVDTTATALQLYYYDVMCVGDGSTTSNSNTAVISCQTLATPPTFVSAETSTDGLTIGVIYSKTMPASPTYSGMSFSGTTSGTHAATGATRDGSNTSKVNYTIASACLNGETITANYTAGNIVASDGGILANFSSQAVTNNVEGAITLKTNLISYYALDETSGSIVDSHGTNTGTTSGTVTQNQAGKLGQSINLNGGFVDTGNITALNGVDKLSAFMWMKMPTVTTDNTLIAKWDYATQGGFAFQTGDGSGIECKLTFFYAKSLTDTGSNKANVTSGLNMAANTWYHVGFVYDGTQSTDATKLKIYLNASSKALTFSSSPPTALQSPSATLKIGKFGGSLPRLFTGNLDEVGIWTRALSDAEVTSLYNSGSGLAYTSF